MVSQGFGGTREQGQNIVGEKGHEPVLGMQEQYNVDVDGGGSSWLEAGGW